jgi:hypothetical protein
VFIVLAYRYASSVKLGPFIYTTIVFTALIDWAIWHRSLTLFVVLGMALVIGGGLVAIRGKTDAPLAAIRSPTPSVGSLKSCTAHRARHQDRKACFWVKLLASIPRFVARLRKPR